jgi:hypothetical protein
MQIDDVSRAFLHVQNNYGQWFSFFKHIFFLSNASKLEMILTLMIIKEKTLEIRKIHFKMHLNMFASNVLLVLKIMKIENMSLTKSYVFFCYLKHGCIMYK